MSTLEIPSGALPKQASTPEEITHFVVEAAVNAPSLHNTQPWWFYGADHEVGMHADVERRLPIADPEGREMMISCGAALFTARVALRYLGIVPKVRIVPEAGLPTLVAKINWTDNTPPAEYERELFTGIPRRRTHRGGFDAEPLPEGLLAALQDEASKENATLLILDDEAQCSALAAVVEAGDYALRQDGARAREEARWAPGPRSKRRDGVPATAYPATPEKTEPDFPGRDFAHGHGWGLPPAGEGLPPVSGRRRPADHCLRPACGLDRRRAGASASAALRNQLRPGGGIAQPAARDN